MFETLFSPIRIRGMELKNRAVMPAMGTKFSGNASFVTPTLIEYHRAAEMRVIHRERKSRFFSLRPV